MGFSATFRRTRRSLACMPLACLLASVLGALAAAPTPALASTPHDSGGNGGVGVTGGSSTGPTSTSTTTATPTARGVVRLGGVRNASGGGITFTVAASGTLGQPLSISGTAPTSSAGALIDIESARPGHTTWTQVATAVIASSGAFSAHWTPSASAKVALRAVLAPRLAPSTGSSSGSTGLAGGVLASAAAGEPATSALTIPIFKDATATLYGPGLWGHHTACGERLGHGTLGVASRTLKCGTRVAVMYDGREITVPVIDRGPFANGASWDLTMATAHALGITETATIGTLTAASAGAVAARSSAHG